MSLGIASLHTLTPATISFGPFRLLPAQRLLFESERSVKIGSRALDILIALLERHGELVTKNDLMARVWPGTTVVEANLAVHVCALRRTLMDGNGQNRYLVTTPGRGYRFVAPIQIGDTQEPSRLNPGAEALADFGNMLTRLISRVAELRRLAETLRETAKVGA